MLVNDVHMNVQTFYNRAGRKQVKNCLQCLGVVNKPHVAEYLLWIILND